MENIGNFVKKYKLFIAVIGLVILILVLLVINSIVSSKVFGMSNEAFKKEAKNYNIEVNYPVFSNKKINKKIDKIISDETNSFKKKIKNDNNVNELNIDYGYTQKDNIYSIHIRTYSYTGDDNEYYYSDEIIYIDESTNKEMAIDNLVKDDIYDALIDSCYKALKENLNIKLYEDKTIKEALHNLKENAILTFSQDSLFVIIPPFIVSDCENDISINIDYSDVYEYLNSDYFTFDKKEMEEIKASNGSNSRDKKFFKDKKLLAITFDDGPNYKVTSGLLDELGKRNARVTFFLVGNRISSQISLIKRMYESGHTIASHTYDHKRLTKLEKDQIINEIDRTNELLKSITGEDVKYLRPPYGSYDKDVLEQIDMSFILWNVDTEDWKTKNAEKVCQNIIDNAEDGNIILLHDLYQTSVDGAICAIDKLQDEGYAFVSIDELISLKGIDIKTHTAYRYFR